MASDGSTQQPCRHRSPPVEIVQNGAMASVRDNRRLSQTHDQTQTKPAITAASPPPGQDLRPPQVWPSGLYAGPTSPPRSHIHLSEAIVGHQDLTLLYDSALYPYLDYGGSFAHASASLLPADVQLAMQNLHRRQRMPRRALRPAAPQTEDQESPPSPTPSTAADRRDGKAAVNPAAPAFTPTNNNTQPPPAVPQAQPAAPRPHPLNPSAAAPRVAGETVLQTVQRLHGIDLADVSLYQDRTAPIPQPIQHLVDQIGAIKKSRRGFPIRTALREQHAVHFASGPGRLKAASFLWHWYGDTRLFTRREWYYLATEGRGDQVP